MKAKPASTFVYRPKSVGVISNSGESEGNRKKQIKSQDVLASGLVDLTNIQMSAGSDSGNIHRGLSGIKIVETPEKEAKVNPSGNAGCSLKEEGSWKQVVTPPSLKVDSEDQLCHQSVAKSSTSQGDSGHSVQKDGFKPFDICPPKKGSPFMLKPSLLVKNRQKRNEARRASDGNVGNVLRPGMVLLKNYLSISDQVYNSLVCNETTLPVLQNFKYIMYLF